MFLQSYNFFLNLDLKFLMSENCWLFLGDVLMGWFFLKHLFTGGQEWKPLYSSQHAEETAVKELHLAPGSACSLDSWWHACYCVELGSLALANVVWEDWTCWAREPDWYLKVMARAWLSLVPLILGRQSNIRKWGLWGQCFSLSRPGYPAGSGLLSMDFIGVFVRVNWFPWRQEPLISRL